MIKIQAIPSRLTIRLQLGVKIKGARPGRAW
jgi:hypothetical protein